MGAFRALPLGRRRIQCRVLVLYRLRPERLAALLPHGLSPRTHAGFSIGCALYTRLESALPNPRAHGSEHLAYRFAVAREDGGPAGWVARRETSSWLEARCSKLLRGPQGRARFRCSENAFALELTVDGERGEELYLRGESAPAPSAGLFRHASELEHFLAAESEVRPQDVFAPEADQLALDKCFAPEPLALFEARSRFLSGTPFEPGEVELDSAWRLVTRRLDPAPARRTTFEALQGRAGGATALPTS